MDTRPSTHYHTLPVKLINAIVRSLNCIGLAKIDLSEAALLAAAREETGLDRFGDESFVPALRALLVAIQSEARLNPFGRIGAKATILGSLKNRLWANACFEAHPEIRQRKIVAPIVVVGLARAGTTRLQRMLAADTRLQHLKAWEGFNPAPRIGQPALGKSARYNEVKKIVGLGRRLNPGADTAHPIDADWAEEEILLINHSFCGLGALAFGQGVHYYNQLLNCDKSAGYRYMRDLMNLVSWSRGDAENKRWVLKTPQHMLDLEQLMNVFPDAKLVFTHRDPLKTVVSTLSLGWHFTVMNTDRPCRASVKDVWLDVCEQMASRSMRARDSIPAAQQLDVYYSDMNNNWDAVVQRVYDFVDMEFTPAAKHSMAQWLAQSKRENRHGGHQYSFEDFGTTREEVDARMKFFRDRYAIPYEDR